MSGKITDEQLYEAEKRMTRSEKIISFISDEEKTNPDLLIREVIYIYIYNLYNICRIIIL